MGTDTAQSAHLGDPLHTKESILSPPQPWPWQQVWCMSYSKKSRFHLLSWLGCCDQAWSCLAGTPQQPGLHHLHRIVLFPVTQPSLDPLFPDPVCSQMNNSSPINFSTLVLPLIYQYTNMERSFTLSLVISVLYSISDVHCCPCKIPPSKGSQLTPLIAHEVQPTFT